ncbi:MAG: adenylyltransferase/cytidyltransferase family protein [Desulfovibrionaceae bacterium]|nr:adenylyltransferase/cytidyltransferase family protein [Desulfovibrionaceae bacterium]
MTRKRVFVSGCFDLLHSGHVAFFRAAAGYGDLYVGVGSDETVCSLKNRRPVNSEDERLYMVRSIRWVKDAWISSGSGLLDFEPELRRFLPDIFLVNRDGDAPEKASLCKALGIAYIVLERTQEDGLPVRSSTELRQRVVPLPYRVEIAGGWLDQPAVSRLAPGPVVCASIEPTHSFFDYGGMSTSTRKGLLDLFQGGLPLMEPEKLARLAFRYENGIDLQRGVVSGAQDAIGICVPGLTRQNYAGTYWPESIEILQEEETLAWLERTIFLYPLRPRTCGYDPTEGSQPTVEGTLALSAAADKTWSAIQSQNTAQLAQGITTCRMAQQAMFPAMFPPDVMEVAMALDGNCTAWKFTGAGGGGYLILVQPQRIEPLIAIRIRRSY